MAQVFRENLVCTNYIKNLLIKNDFFLISKPKNIIEQREYKYSRKSYKP